MCADSDAVTLGVLGLVAVWDTSIDSDREAPADSVMLSGLVVDPEADNDKLREGLPVRSVAENVGWVRLEETEVEVVSDGLKCVNDGVQEEVSPVGEVKDCVKLPLDSVCEVVELKLTDAEELPSSVKVCVPGVTECDTVAVLLSTSSSQLVYNCEPEAKITVPFGKTYMPVAAALGAPMETTMGPEVLFDQPFKLCTIRNTFDSEL